MTELERRALMGDQEAQWECTEKGIVLGCPICNSDITIESHPEYTWAQYAVLCPECLFTFDEAFYSKKDAIAALNTRPAPPIGRCGECKYYESEGPGVGTCNGSGKTDNDFCSCFEPKRNDER